MSACWHTLSCRGLAAAGEGTGTGLGPGEAPGHRSAPLGASEMWLGPAWFLPEITGKSWGNPASEKFSLLKIPF